MFNWFRNLLKRDGLSIQALRQFIYGPATLAGVSVSEEMALGQSAVWRACDLISSNIARLDAEVYRRVPGKGKLIQRNHRASQILKDPNDYQSAFDFWSTYVLHCICSGNAYAEIERDVQDQPVALHLVHWRNIIIKQKDEYSPHYYHLIREGKDIPIRDMLHLKMLSWNGIYGISPVRAMRETLGIGIAQERYSGSVFGNGGVPRGVIQAKDNLNPTTKDAIREAWEILHGGPENANKVAILGGGAQFIETNMSPADAELLTSRTFQIEEIARIFGVPTNLLFSGNQQSYNSNEENNTQFFELGLRPIVEKLECEFDTKLIAREERWNGMFVKYDVSRMTKGNYANTINAVSRGVLTGILTQNEGRGELGLNPIEGGDVLLVPTNMMIGQDPAENSIIQGNLTKPDPKKPDKEGKQENQLSLPDLRSEAVQVATRAALLDQIGRAARRQAKSKPEPDVFRSYLVEALGPTLTAYMAAHGLTGTAEGFAARWIAYTRERAADALTAEELLNLVGDQQCN